MKKVILFFIFLLIIWEISVFNFNNILYPSPLNVFNGLLDSSNLFSDSLISLFRLITGSLIGIVFAVFFGIITGHFSFVNDTIGKFSNFVRFIPPLALVPLFLLWFGIGEISKIGLLAFTSFFPAWISTHNGVRNLEKKYLLVAKSLNIKGFKFLKEVLFKGSIEYILNGARIGVGFAFSVLVAAEMIGAYSGLGFRIFFLQSVYRVDMMLAYIIVLGILGVIIDKMFLLVSKGLVKWKA